MNYAQRANITPPYRLLALDGGGIRGVMTLSILARIEKTLRTELGEDERFRLSHWFDYIGGTSTGAIIAAGLAKGMSVKELVSLYDDLGPKMFKKPLLPRRLWYRYVSGPLQEALKAEFKDMLFGDMSLQTLLLLVLRNESTDSPWPLSNAPGAKYNDPAHPGNNLNLPLWQLVRASTAAPVFFPAERAQIGDQRFTFQDGGLTSYNNPAFQLFLMATMDAYNVGWETGEDKMLLVSVGTGYNPKANANLRLSRLHVLHNAQAVPSALMFAAQVQQDALCRVFGRCLVGEWIDGEVKDLKTEVGVVEPKLFTYLRYNAALSPAGMQQLQLHQTGIDPDGVARLDSVEHIDDLRRIGDAVAKQVEPDHYRPFLRPLRR
jgi:uncharacterized protein